MSQTLSLHEDWSIFRKITFRFLSLFFLLFVFPFPFNLIPEIGADFYTFYYRFWGIVCEWGASVFLNIDTFTVDGSGSGDNLFYWVQMLMVIIISGAGCILWSVLDRKRKSYAKLWHWFHLIIVYNLAYWLFSYGFIKVFGEQFGNIGIGRMLETYGESSPMRILWTFMSVSEPYEQFSGWGEAIAGFLLLFRRTRTMGALVGAGVMLNVFTLNMTYDVPVKLFSFQLLVQALYIASADYKRLLALFLVNQPVPKIDWPSLFTTTWKNRLLLSVQILFAGYMIYNEITGSLPYNEDPNQPRPALYGIHDVDQFVINGDTLSPLTTDTIRWSKAYMDFPGYFGQRFVFKDMQNDSHAFNAEIDSVKQHLLLRPLGDTINVYTLNYKWIDKNLQLEGILNGDTLKIQTKYFDPDDFIVRSRGFNWISEEPYNRRVLYK